MKRLIAGNLTAREVKVIKSCLALVIECNGTKDNPKFHNEVCGLYDMFTHAEDVPETPYVGVTKDVELVIEMLNDDYAGYYLDSGVYEPTAKTRRSFVKGLGELNNLVNCHKR